MCLKYYVLVTISDKKIGYNDGNGIVGYYRSAVVSAMDYAPFGMPMVGRIFRANLGYRYGFNGKENDNEVKGDGNEQDYGMRVYDPRLGRFLSVDPITSKYPELTPYQFAANRPIEASDLDGAEADDKNEEIKESDIPTEKHDKPSFAKVLGKQFMGMSHQASAQIFANTREKQPGVVGVVTYDEDEFNTVAITYTKTNKIQVDPDGTNTYTTKIEATYTIFRMDGADSKLRDLREEQFFAKSKSELYGKEVLDGSMLIPSSGGPARGIFKAAAKGSKYLALKYAAKYGVKAYELLKGQVAGAEAHHLIEQRFAALFPEFKAVTKWNSIIVTKAEHIIFTTRWRQEIGLSNWKKLLITTNAQRQDVINAARKVYADYPEILKYIPSK